MLDLPGAVMDDFVIGLANFAAVGAAILVVRVVVVVVGTDVSNG